MTTRIGDPLIITTKSTNVRSPVSAPVWLRASFSAAGYLAPSLTAAVAERLGHQRILRAEPVTNVAVSFIDAAKHQKAAA